MRGAISEPGTPVLDDGSAAQEVLGNMVARLAGADASSLMRMRVMTVKRAARVVTVRGRCDGVAARRGSR